MKINKVVWIILGAVGILAVVGYFIYSSRQSASQSQYQTVALTRGDLSASVGATGTVRAVQSAALSWQTSGIVEKVHVKIGYNC